VNGLLRVIHEPTPSKWPADDSADDPTDDPADDTTNDSADDPADDFTDDPTLALLLLLTAFVQTTQATPLKWLAELPLFINVTVPFINITALPINITALPINIAAPPINVTGILQARLNHTLNSLTIGLKLVQPIATVTTTAIIPPRTQTPTLITP
jgi:hypothetical protein